MMFITLEDVQGISFDVEIVRHFEVVPGEECPLQVDSAVLSHNYVSALDLLRQKKILDLFDSTVGDPDATTKQTIWSMSPVLTAYSKNLRVLSMIGDDYNENKVRGLFWNVAKWLIGNVGIPLV